MIAGPEPASSGNRTHHLPEISTRGVPAGECPVQCEELQVGFAKPNPTLAAREPLVGRNVGLRFANPTCEIPPCPVGLRQSLSGHVSPSHTAKTSVQWC